MPIIYIILETSVVEAWGEIGGRLDHALQDVQSLITQIPKGVCTVETKGFGEGHIFKEQYVTFCHSFMSIKYHNSLKIRIKLISGTKIRAAPRHM